MLGRKRKTTTTNPASAAESPAPSEAGSTAPRKRPPPTKCVLPKEKDFSERDVRNLYNAIRKWGYAAERWDQIVNDAHVQAHEPAKVKDMIDELFAECRKAVHEQEEREKAHPLSGVERKKQKALLIEVRGAKGLNAASFLERAHALPLLHKLLAKQTPKTFRLTQQIKQPSGWACPWGVREDTMLLFGLDRHGFGAWQQMKEDDELDMSGKFYLDEGEKLAPGPVHLARRSDTLLLAIRDMDKPQHANGDIRKHMTSDRSGAAGVAKKKSGSGRQESSVGGSLKKKSSLDKAKSKPKLERNGSAAGSPNAAGAPPKKLKKELSAIEQEAAAAGDDFSGSEYESMDEADCKRALKPVKQHLRRLRASREMAPADKKQALKECLVEVGRFIDAQTAAKGGARRDEKRATHLWVFASYFWPAPLSHRNLVKLYDRYQRPKESPIVGGGGGGAAIKPEPKTSPA